MSIASPEIRRAAAEAYLSGLMIAHRLTAVTQCDLIYRVENGRIVDAGSTGEIFLRYAALMES
jgi:ABC-type multidrug transport system fused ATPase/permease subunit